jgi:hypothetical protein
LNQEITEVEQIDIETREKTFLENLRQKGFLDQIPQQISDDKLRQNFNRIEIKREPLSETFVKERV